MEISGQFCPQTLSENCHHEPSHPVAKPQRSILLIHDTRLKLIKSFLYIQIKTISIFPLPCPSVSGCLLFPDKLHTPGFTTRGSTLVAMTAPAESDYSQKREY